MGSYCLRNNLTAGLAPDKVLAWIKVPKFAKTSSGDETSVASFATYNHCFFLVFIGHVATEDFGMLFVPVFSASILATVEFAIKSQR